MEWGATGGGPGEFDLFFIHLATRRVYIAGITPHPNEQEYVVHHHHERNHQGKENLLLFPASEQLHQSEGRVCSRERLGGQ